MENLTQQRILRQISIGITLMHVLTENERRCERLLSQAAARIKGMGSTDKLDLHRRSEP